MNTRMDIKEIRKICKEIIGFSIYDMNRTTDLFCLQIGNGTDYKGLFEVGQYTFHIQCSWRITNGDIILGRGDIYNPATGVDYEEFDCGELNNSRFDEKLVQLKKDWNKKLNVLDVEVRDSGDLKITFENGIILDTFIERSDEEEEWRLIDYKTSEHYVVVVEMDYSEEC